MFHKCLLGWPIHVTNEYFLSPVFVEYSRVRCCKGTFMLSIWEKFWNFKISYSASELWSEFPLPVRIRVRIGPPYPLVCRKGRLIGAVLRMRPEKGPVLHQGVDDKDSPCWKALSAEHRPKFCRNRIHNWF
jgi:hypothetical protein